MFPINTVCLTKRNNISSYKIIKSKKKRSSGQNKKQKKFTKRNYYSYGEHCWLFLQICINFNTKWRASNTFEATVAGLKCI